MIIYFSCLLRAVLHAIYNYQYIFSGAVFVLAILLLSKTWCLLQQSSLRTYLAGMCHGFAVICVLLLIYNVTLNEIQHLPKPAQGSESFIYITANGSYICSRRDHGDVTKTGMDVWLVFLASYTLCLILCNAVVNCKLVARHHQVWPQGIM